MRDNMLQTKPIYFELFVSTGELCFSLIYTEFGSLILCISLQICFLRISVLLESTPLTSGERHKTLYNETLTFGF